MTIGERIKNLREERGWTQLELADKISMNNSVLSRIESGKRRVEDHEIKQFADVFEVTTDYLLGRKPGPNIAFFDGGEKLTEEEMEYLKESLELFRKMKARQKEGK